MPSRRAFMSVALGGAVVASAKRAVFAQATARPTILVFDVIETMLDLNALAPHFARVFGNREALDDWFSTLLLYSNVATLSGPYSDFGSIAGAALDMVAEARGVRLTAADRDQILGGTRSLPAHPDVRPALEQLRKERFRLVTLTNSALPAVEAQLKSAGLAELFERSFSVDTVKRFKPAAEPYGHVAQQMGVTVGDLRLVAAHAWDIVGALQAGCRAAFVARPGKVLYPLGPKPDIFAPTLGAVAQQIIAKDR